MCRQNLVAGALIHFGLHGFGSGHEVIDAELTTASVRVTAHDIDRRYIQFENGVDEPLPGKADDGATD
jgi:hypothetical protein